ncbi:MAG: thioredoxin [Faecalibacterium sp.]|jgi:thioredoxin 1|nr:thioredoxin [Faecalibacterium sp.]
MAVTKLTSANFEQEVANSTQPVVVDFWASWCGPCQMLSPVLEEVAETVSGVKVMKCNVDEEMPLAAKFGIDSIPALLKFENGTVKARSIGFVPKEQVKAFLMG